METELLPQAPLGPPEPDDELGNVGPYRLLSELGRGGAGVVYVARSERLDRLVALKLLRAERANLEELRERFEIEARSAARLRHPNIVGIHEVGEDAKGRPYLVMELVNGRTLAARLAEEGALPGREAARIAERLARALGYAHSRGVLHRDVKPGNVLLGGDGEPLLSDFGLAKVIEDGASTPTVTGQVMGTPAYMAPEQARGEPVDARSDVWSVGATLHEMLAGRVPLPGPSVAAILARVTGAEPVPPLRGGDRDLATVVARCLEKEPGERYRTAGELADDLARWLKDEPILARPPGPVLRLFKWLRRNKGVARTLLASGLVLLVLGVLAGVTFFERITREKEKAEEAARLAALERDRARAAAGEANLALDALIIEVQEGLEDVPGEQVRAARRRLLMTAAERLLRLQALGVEEETVAAELQRRIGQLALEAGQVEPALRAMRQGVRLTRARLAATPRDDRLAWELVLSLAQEAEAERQSGDATASKAALEEAVALLGPLRARPWIGEHTIRAADTCGRLAEARLAADDVEGARRVALEGLALVVGRLDLPEPQRSMLESSTLASAAQAISRGTDPARAIPLFEAAAALDRSLVDSARGWTSRRSLAAGLIDLADVAAAAGQRPRARAAYAEAVGLARGLVAADPDGTDGQRTLALCVERLGNLALDQGDLETALRSAEEALAIRRELVRRDPASAVYRADVSSALDTIGSVHERRGELEPAAAAWSEALALDREQLARDPGSVQARHGVIHALTRLSGVRRLLSDREGAVAAIDEALALVHGLPGERGKQRCDLLIRRIEIHLDQGELDQAAAALDEALSHWRAARASSPASLEGRAGMAACHSLQAELAIARGEREGARASMDAAVAEWEEARRLAPNDLQARSGLAKQLVERGDLERELGEHEEAERRYQAALALRRQLQAEDPGVPLAEREVLVVLSRLAELAGKRGDRAGARATLEEILAGQRRLLAIEPGPAREHDVAVALIKLGETARALGDHDASAPAFEEAEQRLQALVDLDPGDVRTRRDLFAATTRVVLALLAQRRLDEALAAAERHLAIAEKLVELEHGTPSVRRDRSLCLMRRADVHAARGDHAAAVRDLEAAVESHRAVVKDEPKYAAELARMEQLLASQRP